MVAIRLDSRCMVRHRSSFPLPRRPSGSAGFPCSRWDQPESSAFVNCYVFSFVTLDEILWRFTRGVMHVPFEFHVGSDLLDDDSTNPTSLGIPSRTCSPILNVFGITVMMIRRFSQMIKSISTSG
jgi:hypothetical protein